MMVRVLLNSSYLYFIRRVNESVKEPKTRVLKKLIIVPMGMFSAFSTPPRKYAKRQSKPSRALPRSNLSSDGPINNIQLSCTR
jgi:hypothetical protein